MLCCAHESFVSNRLLTACFILLYTYLHGSMVVTVSSIYQLRWRLCAFPARSLLALGARQAECRIPRMLGAMDACDHTFHPSWLIPPTPSPEAYCHVSPILDELTRLGGSSLLPVSRIRYPQAIAGGCEARKRVRSCFTPDHSVLPMLLEDLPASPDDRKQ